MATSKLRVDPSLLEKAEDPRWALAFARIESHYFVNAGFFPEGYILDNVDRIRHIPTTIVQVRFAPMHWHADDTTSGNIVLCKILLASFLHQLALFVKSGFITIPLHDDSTHTIVRA